MRWIAIAAATALGFFTVGQVQAESSNSARDTYKQLELFGTVLDRIRADYVEEVSDAELIKAAIDGMLSSLDPHSSYLDEEDRERLDVDTRGEFGGLGIEVTMEGGYVKVVSPIDDTPAAKAGLKPNDLIIALDGKSVRGMALSDAVKLMRGKVGEKIKLTVRRGEDTPFEVEIIRDVIKVSPVRARAEGKAGYIRVSSFSRQTEPNLVKAVKQLRDEIGTDIEGFILDLRNNPGGLLDQAISVSDAFLEKGEIVSTRGRNPEEGERYNAKPGDIVDGKPIVVLINGGSASASEIVAGALKDHRRAIIVGTQSFGKGSVQTVMPLRGSAAMRLTTSRYYTPSGRSIQNLGVTPDIIVKQPRRRPDAENEEEGIRFNSEADLRGSLSNDSLSEEEIRQLEEDREKAENAARLRDDDYQLAYAIDILRGLSAIGAE